MKYSSQVNTPYKSELRLASQTILKKRSGVALVVKAAVHPPNKAARKATPNNS